MEIQAINEKVSQESRFVEELLGEIRKVIVGQKYLLDRLLIGALTQGHLLLEGVPGLAKTLSVKTFAAAIAADFRRIQFTPDLLPADLIGTMIFHPQDATFHVKKGPIFAHIVLADEINRAPAKVQSALLEAMEERQVTIGDATYPLAPPFLVLATQNPIDQEGTYPLPEAQVDRFMLKLRVGYPNRDEEKEILNRMTGPELPAPRQVIGPEDLLRIQRTVQEVYVDDRIRDYILQIVLATRKPNDFGLDLAALIQYGASPRATIFLLQAARAHAFLRGRGFVTPEDVKAIGPDVLRHRVLLTYEAEAEEVTSDGIVQQIFDAVEVP